MSNPLFYRIKLILFFALMFAFLWGMSRFSYARQHWVRLNPTAISGDEPHYLIITHSLLFDHDLQMQNNYQAMGFNDYHAGVKFRRKQLDHHTFFYNRDTGARLHANYVLNYKKNRICGARCIDYERLLPEWDNPPPAIIEVPAHGYTYPALVAALIAPFNPSRQEVEPYAATILLWVNWLGVVGVYFAARAMGQSTAAAIIASLLLGVASSWLPYTRSFFSEVPIGTALVLAFWAHLRNRPVLCGLAISAAATFKMPFVVVGVVWGVHLLLSKRYSTAWRFAAATAACLLPHFYFNMKLAGTPFVVGSQTLVWSYYTTILSAKSGLLIFTPWVVLAGIMCIVFLREKTATPQKSAMIDLGVSFMVIYALFGSVDGSGTCYGPRYWIPMLPLLAIAAATSVDRNKLQWRLALGVLALVSAVIAITGVMFYELSFNRPVQYALAMFIRNL